MLNQVKEKNIADYEAIRPAYVAFAKKLEALLKDILEQNDIKFQVVESRAKDLSSFSEKLVRPGKHYKDPLNEISDLCGCRIVLYYEDDVARASNVIKSEFNINEENLSRQPELLEVDRFGYLSAHYIISLGKSRSELIEWRAFGAFKAEVQIRTVIQHAWSAVSHALQYKQETSVPSKLQRRLHRIAGIFELADEEFVSIRKMKEDLQFQAKKDVQEGRDNIAITPALIQEFLTQWPKKKTFVSDVSSLGFSFPHGEEQKFTDLIYDLAILAGVTDLNELQKSLDADYKDFFRRLLKIHASSTWNLNYDFAVALFLIFNARDRITKDFLLKRGHFHSDVADSVIKALNVK